MFLHTDGALSLIVLALVGALLSPMFALTLVIAQNLMQGRLGTTAGLMTGVGFGVGGLSVTGLGVVADTWGVEDGHAGAQRPARGCPWVCMLFLPADGHTEPAAEPCGGRADRGRPAQRRLRSCVQTGAMLGLSAEDVC